MAKRAAAPSDEEGDFTPSSPEAVASTSKAGEPASKKVKANGATTTGSSKSVQQIMSMSEAALKSSNKDQLVQYVLALQAAAQHAAQGTSGNAAPTQEETLQKAQMYRDTIAKGIKRQMTWK